MPECWLLGSGGVETHEEVRNFGSVGGQHPTDLRAVVICFPLSNHLFQGPKPLFCTPVKQFSLPESRVLVADVV